LLIWIQKLFLADKAGSIILASIVDTVAASRHSNAVAVVWRIEL
jgi:hypothetical protein